MTCSQKLHWFFKGQKTRKMEVSSAELFIFAVFLHQRETSRCPRITCSHKKHWLFKGQKTRKMKVSSAELFIFAVFCIKEHHLYNTYKTKI